MAGDESEDDSQKTEDPTPKKLQEARKRGQVAMSREVNNWAMLFAGTLFIGVMAGPMMTGMAGFCAVLLKNPICFLISPMALVCCFRKHFCKLCII